MSTSTVPSARLTTLDVVRGLTVAAMILVNNNGDSAHTWPFFEHAPWNGFTLADFVFPSFLFMVGISIEFSLRSRLAKGAAKAALVLPILRRSALIFACGLMISGFPFYNLHTLRIYGVLQRIALCFLASGLLALYTRTRTIVVTTAALLLGFWILLRFVPVPGLGMPVRDLPMLDPYANIVSWTDRAIFPVTRLYHHGVYDPCGLLGTFPSIASTLLGVLAGKWLLTASTQLRKLQGIAAASIACIAAGLLWSPWFPINKRIWTSSYVLFAGGLALALFAICYWLLDLHRKQKPPVWTWPALAFGTNALAVYIFSELLASGVDVIHIHAGGHTSSLRRLLFLPIQHAVPNPYLASLLYGVSFVGVCFVPMAVLYHRRIFIKV